MRALFRDPNGFFEITTRSLRTGNTEGEKKIRQDVLLISRDRGFVGKSNYKMKAQTGLAFFSKDSQSLFSGLEAASEVSVESAAGGQIAVVAGKYRVKSKGPGGLIGLIGAATKAQKSMGNDESWFHYFCKAKEEVDWKSENFRNIQKKGAYVLLSASGDVPTRVDVLKVINGTPTLASIASLMRSARREQLEDTIEELGF